MSVTLAQIQQAVARRCGPYRQVFNDRQDPGTATFDSAFCPLLRSNIELDQVTNLHLLRRGEVMDGGLVNVDITDRDRLVSNYTAAEGRVDVDRSWGNAPIPGEIFEFHHLAPDDELGEAVIAGLRRCYFEDSLYAQPNAQYGGIDLTALAPWIIEPWQVSRVQYGWLNPSTDAPFEATRQAGHVWLQGTSGYFSPIAVWVSYWRPAASWINGTDSTDGPTSDWDAFDVDLDYAAAAGHIEAWHLFPSRLAAAAAGGLQASQQMAAQEFTRQALIHGPQRSQSVGFSSLFSGSGTWGKTWVNR
jgi:hypothetical protein